MSKKSATQVGIDCFVCGNNSKGILANGKKSGQENKLQLCKRLSNGNPHLQTFIKVVFGFSHGVALTETGQVYTWGDNTYHQLGYETPPKGAAAGQPVSVSSIGESIVQVSVGIAHTLALTSKGDVYSWGDNRYGQLGHGDKGPRKTPSRVTASAAPDVVSMTAAFNTSAFITKQGELYLWGWLPGHQGMQMTPKAVPFPDPIVQVAIGSRHILALAASGRVWSWGWSDFFQLGHGDRAPRDTPQLIETFAKVRVVSVAAGANFSLALMDDGQVYAWGAGTALGLDAKERIGPTVINFYSHTISVQKIVCGWAHVVVLTKSGAVYTVGSGQFGQLGHGTKKDQVTPALLKGVTAFDVVAGPHSTAVMTGERPLASPVVLATLMEKKRAQFVQAAEPSKVWIGTYNVGGQKPVDADLTDWFPASPPSLVVVGLQEVVDLKRVADHLLSPKQVDHSGVEWRKKIEATLKVRYPDRSFAQVLPLVHSGGEEDYQPSELQMVGMVMYVFVDQDHDRFIGDVENGVLGRGKTELLKGYKGAVALRMTFHATSFAFINCHLAAHLERMEKRNEDYHAIASSIKFPSKQLLFDTQCIFWFGDLNYRIDLPLDRTKNLIGDGKWEELIKHDQLTRVIRDGVAFSGMMEAPISFAPTYKYDLGLNIYDTSAKHRVPAYCDRVLWKGARITSIEYRRAEIFLSDHRPVAALFAVDHTDRDEYEAATTSPQAAGRAFTIPSTGAASKRRSAQVSGNDGNVPLGGLRRLSQQSNTPPVPPMDPDSSLSPPPSPAAPSSPPGP